MPGKRRPLVLSGVTLCPDAEVASIWEEIASWDLRRTHRPGGANSELAIYSCLGAAAADVLEPSNRGNRCFLDAGLYVSFNTVLFAYAASDLSVPLWVIAFSPRASQIC